MNDNQLVRHQTLQDFFLNILFYIYTTSKNNLSEEKLNKLAN